MLERVTTVSPHSRIEVQTRLSCEKGAVYLFEKDFNVSVLDTPLCFLSASALAPGC